MYFVASDKAKAVFPFASGPVAYLKARPLDSIIPGEQVRSIIGRLQIPEPTYNSIHDHQQQQESPPADSN